MTTIKFGTEGWRAIMAEEFTAENGRLVTQAIAEYMLRLRAEGARSDALAVGYDTRFLSDRFAMAVSEVLAANGLTALLSDRAVPTCAVSRYVVDKQLLAGIMITASHNPPAYNGIKVKEHFGGSANTDTVAAIEQLIGHPFKRVTFHQAQQDGRIKTLDMETTFLNGIRRSVNLAAIKRAPLRVVIDSMHGAGDSLIERLLKGGRCKVTTLHADPDPRFGGHAPEPIPTHLTELKRAVVKSRAHLGIANDGDADRIGVIGPNGQFVNPGQLLCVLLDHLMHQRKWRGPVVKTVSNTSMIDRMTSALGLKLIETPVGFKHVAKEMMRDNALIGGEESGGIGVRGYLPERDGVFIGLLAMEAMAVQGKRFSDILAHLEKQYGRWIYARRDLTVEQERLDRFFDSLRKNPPERIAGVPVAKVNTLDGIKLIDRDEGWLLFRRSGTEPIVRVYAESLKPAQVKRLLDDGVRLIEAA